MGAIGLAWQAMNAARCRRTPYLLLILCVVGCTGSFHKPGQFSDNAATQPAAPAKPASSSNFGSSEDRTSKLDVRFLPCSNAAGSECVLIATVVDEKGKLVTGKQIKWRLEGNGHVIDVDDRGFWNRGKLLDSRSAVSYTGRSTDVIPRKPGRVQGGYSLQTGETWCIISSAAEGETTLTVEAPELTDPKLNTVTVKQPWFDAALALPPAQTGRPGDPVQLSTKVYRRADNQPLANYWIRYKYLDGPTIILKQSGSTEALVTSDAAGQAAASVSEVSKEPGRTRLSVTVERPDAAGKSSVVVSRGETVIDWQAPAFYLTQTGPTNVPVGQDATFTITVRNGSTASTPFYTVRATVPDNAEFKSADPPPLREGNLVIWTLGALAGGASRDLHLVLKPTKVGFSLTSRANLFTSDGPVDEKAISAQVVEPPAAKLEVTASAPPVALLMGNAADSPLVTCQVVVRNPGTAPATNVAAHVVFPKELEHTSRQDHVDFSVGTLQPGESRPLSVPLRPILEGNADIKVTATADGGLTAAAAGGKGIGIRISKTGLDLKLTGPAMRYVGQPADWTLVVTNKESLPLQQVVVRDVLPQELEFVSATVGGNVVGREVVWNIGSLGANESRQLSLTTKATRLNPRVSHVATVSAQPALGTGNPVPLGTLQARAEAALAVDGMAAFKLQVADTADPLHVGEHTTYRITVTNQGSKDGEHLQVTAQVPPEVRVVTVWGPGGYRANGDKLEFSPVDHLAAGGVLNYAVEVETQKAGDVRFHVELAATTLKEPIVKEESTNVR